MIITDEKALRTLCTDATSDEVGTIIDSLERELEHSNKIGKLGIGLAAIQIGIPKNVAIVRMDNLYRADLVNCRIAHKYDSSIFRGEGCLSFPGRIEDTMRYQEIHVVNNLVYPKSLVAKGLFAVVIQHELDHMNNVLLPDIAIAKPKKKVGPNDPCACGSKIKFKRCCGKGIK